MICWFKQEECNKFLVRLHGEYNILVLLALMKIRAYGSKALQ